MRALNYIFFATFIDISWGGLILHKIRDSLHSKIYDDGFDGKTNQNSPVININNQQQVSQATSTISTNYHQQHHQYVLNRRGDYGSLPSSGHQSYNAGIDSNFKAGDINYHRRGGSSHGSHSMGSDFGGGYSHHMMKQESYNHRNIPKFGYHHDKNMFGNTRGFGSSNSGLLASSSSLSSSSAHSLSSSVPSSSSSSSAFGSSISKSGKRPWNRLY